MKNDNFIKKTLRVFAKRFKLMKFGIKVFAQSFSIFSLIFCLITCRALFKIFHHTKDEIKVFCLLFFKIFSSFLCKVTLRVFAKRFKLMKSGIKVFAQPFSIFSSFLCKVTLRVFAKRFKLMKFGMKVFAQPFSKGWLTKRKNLSII